MKIKDKIVLNGILIFFVFLLMTYDSINQLYKGHLIYCFKGKLQLFHLFVNFVHKYSSDKKANQTKQTYNRAESLKKTGQSDTANCTDNCDNCCTESELSIGSTAIFFLRTLLVAVSLAKIIF